MEIMINHPESSWSRGMENWARSIAKHTDEELDHDSYLLRIDNELPLCPICHNHPNAWLDKDKDRGVLRYCGCGCVVVSDDPEHEPVSARSLEIAWRKVPWRNYG